MRSALLLLAVVQVATSEASVSEAFAVDFLQRRLEIGKELKRPNILLFIADDQGWAGLGAHRTDKGEEEAQGKAETQTPTMDNLIREGILLERHYTSSQSAPARSSLLSGRLPSHCWPGKPEGVSNAQMFWNRSDNVSGFLGIPRNMTAFPRKLQEVGYATHYVGKWDAGYATPEHTPLGRGYDSFLGFLQGGIDAWTKGHGKVTDDVVLDVCLNKFRDFSLYNASYRARVGHQVARELGCNVRASLGKPLFVNATGCLDSNISLCWPESCYADEMLLKYAAKIIRTHDSKKQLFLTYASRSVHSALEVPAAYMQRLDDMVAQTGVARALPWTLQRKEMAALQLHMDTVLGKLILAFKDKGMYDNLLIVYLSDNGGGVNLYENGNNYPLKSGKYTDWEGGVRTNAFIGGGAVPVEKRGSTFNGVIHISDWYATLCTLAGADYVDHAAEEANKILRAQQLPLLAPVDSRPQWQHIMLGTNGREDTLHLSSKAVLRWPHKLVTGQQMFSFWPGPIFPQCGDRQHRWIFWDIFGRKIPALSGAAFEQAAHFEDCSSGCLFNIEEDPSERKDLAASPEHAALLAELQEELRHFNLQSTTALLGHPTLDACMKAVSTRVVGPFVDADNFYTRMPPADPEMAMRDAEEILQLHEALRSNPGLPSKVARSLPVSREQECLEE